MTDDRFRNAVAVIGFAGRFPGARDTDEFWRNIRAGVETLETWTDEQLDEAGIPLAVRNDPRFVRKGCRLDEADHFDAAFFGYAPREAQIVDPQQRVFLECAWHALEHAGYAGKVSGASVGVYGGASMQTYLMAELLADASVLETVGVFPVFIGNDKDFLCTRVSYELDLRGPSLTIQTACSTSLVAVQVAYMALRRGECDLALAGGVSIPFPEHAGYVYAEGMIFSPDGHCRPFDARAQGTRPGTGAGIVVLKRFSEAVEDGDTIHAVILGAATNNDGAGKAGFTAPSIDGQVEVVATAQAIAGIDARSVSYVETHGTATQLGDPIEIAALRTVFTESTSDTGFCHLGAVKANIGHLDAAAGVAGLIKTILALEHGEIPPLVNFESPNPRLEIDGSPFVLDNKARRWERGAGPRRAGVSSFGIGGTNAHVVLEEAPAPSGTVSLRGPQLLVLSARTPTALDAASAQLAEFLDANDGVSLPDVAYTLQVGRAEFTERRALVATDTLQAVDMLSRRAPSVVTGSHAGGTRPVSFLFPGQGSQYSGMGKRLYESEQAYRDAFDRCSMVLAPILESDPLLYQRGGDEVTSTAIAQPILFIVEYSLAKLWMSWGVSPVAMLGHSIGEFVAAHLAGVMDLEDALRIVVERGRLMQAQPAGAMLSVQLSEEAIREWLGDGVELAAVNAPGVCAVSGPVDVLAQLAQRLTAAGIAHRRLKTSHAFHSSMMDGAVAKFVEVVSRATLRPPELPYVSNVTGTWITAAEATSPEYYGTHLRQPVRFADGIRTLTADRPDILLEVGPGTALTTLARATIGPNASGRAASSLSHPREKRDEVESMLDGAGRLWVAGAQLDWKAMHEGEQLHRIPLPLYPFERQQYRIRGARRRAAAMSRAADAPALDSALPHGSAAQRAPTVTDPPATETERRIAMIWTEILGVEQIGRQDSFFDLGGDSLMATRVTARLRAVFGREVEFDRVLSLPTIAALAEMLDATSGPERESVSF